MECGGRRLGLRRHAHRLHRPHRARRGRCLTATLAPWCDRGAIDAASIAMAKGNRQMAYQRGRNDYAAIRDEANDPYTLATPVTLTELEEMLDCVPPIYVTGGFLVGECLTGDDRGDVYAHYA